MSRLPLAALLVFIWTNPIKAADAFPSSQQQFCDTYQQYFKDLDRFSMMSPLERATSGTKNVDIATYVQRAMQDIHTTGDMITGWVGVLVGVPDSTTGGARLSFSFTCPQPPNRRENERAGIQLQTPARNEQWPRWNAMIGKSANGYRLQSPIIQMLSHIPGNSSKARVNARLYWLEKGTDENPNRFGVFGNTTGDAALNYGGPFGATITSVQLITDAK